MRYPFGARSSPWADWLPRNETDLNTHTCATQMLECAHMCEDLLDLKAHCHNHNHLGKIHYPIFRYQSLLIKPAISAFTHMNAGKHTDNSSAQTTGGQAGSPAFWSSCRPHNQLT